MKLSNSWSRFECSWCKSPSILHLNTDEIHVWYIDLELSSRKMLEMAQILSSDEQLRTSRFHFKQHRRHFIASRGALRKILGKYLCLDARQLQFSYSSLGKPFLSEKFNKKNINFNLSHSNELGLIALTQNRSIGIDIEFIQPNFDIESIVKHFISPQENNVINSLYYENKQNAFFNLWTLKEAYLKATGEGIGGLHKIEFYLPSNKSLKVVTSKGKNNEANNWTIRQLLAVKGYAAALAVEGTGEYIYRFYRF